MTITSVNTSETNSVQKNCRTLQHCDTYWCWKCLRLTFSSDLEDAMFDTGESLSPNKFKFCFWEKHKVYKCLNANDTIHSLPSGPENHFPSKIVQVWLAYWAELIVDLYTYLPCSARSQSSHNMLQHSQKGPFNTKSRFRTLELLYIWMHIPFKWMNTPKNTPKWFWTFSTFCLKFMLLNPMCINKLLVKMKH